MNYDEIALQLTVKAMEHGLIKPMPVNMCKGPDLYSEASQHAAKLVNDFYQETMHRLEEG